MIDAISSLGDLRNVAKWCQQIDNHLESLQDKEELADNSTTNADGAIYRKQRIDLYKVWSKMIATADFPHTEFVAELDSWRVLPCTT